MTTSVLAKAALIQAAIALKQDLLQDNHWRNGSSARIRQLAKNNLLKVKSNLDIEKFSQAAVDAAMKYARNAVVS